MEEREFIAIEDADGDIVEAELICELESKKEDKTYVILTTDEEIEDEVNIIVGYWNYNGEEQTFELVTDEEEIDYVHSLMDEDIKDMEV